MIYTSKRSLTKRQHQQQLASIRFAIDGRISAGFPLMPFRSTRFEREIITVIKPTATCWPTATAAHRTTTRLLNGLDLVALWFARANQRARKRASGELCRVVTSRIVYAKTDSRQGRRCARANCVPNLCVACPSPSPSKTSLRLREGSLALSRRDRARWRHRCNWSFEFEL